MVEEMVEVLQILTDEAIFLQQESRVERVISCLLLQKRLRAASPKLETSSPQSQVS